MRSFLAVLVASGMLSGKAEEGGPGEPAFDVSGRLVYRIKLEGTNLSDGVSLLYAVSVRGSNWLIRTSSMDGTKYTEAASQDGVIYTVLSGSRRTDTGAIDAALTADAHSGEVPDDDGSNINYLWLAYASAPYFRQRATNWIEPIWLLDDPELRKRHFTMNAVWELSANTGLPNWVVFLSDGYQRMRTQEGSVVRRWPPPFDEGFTNAVFSVMARTNCSGFWVPSEFSFARFGLVSRAGSQRFLATITRTDAVAREVSAASARTRGRMLPGFAGVVRVSDSRFRRANPPLYLLEYSVTNGAWPDAEQLLRLYKAQAQLALGVRAQRIEAEATRSYKRHVIFATMILLIAGTAYLTLRLNRH